MEEKFRPGRPGSSCKDKDESLDFVQLMMMGDQPWWKVKCHPHDAVDQEQITKDRILDSPLIQVGLHSPNNSVTVVTVSSFVYHYPLLTHH